MGTTDQDIIYNPLAQANFSSQAIYVSRKQLLNFT